MPPSNEIIIIKNKNPDEHLAMITCRRTSRNDSDEDSSETERLIDYFVSKVLPPTKQYITTWPGSWMGGEVLERNMASITT